MQVYEQARQLVEVLKQEEVYKEFIGLQLRVFGDPKLKELLLTLRRREFELHRRQLQGAEVSDEEKQGIEELHSKALQEEELQRYLDAEYRFSRLMLDIQKIINAAVPVRRPCQS